MLYNVVIGILIVLIACRSESRPVKIFGIAALAFFGSPNSLTVCNDLHVRAAATK